MTTLFGFTWYETSTEACFSRSPAIKKHLVFFRFDHRLYFPAQLVRGFTLSDLLDKPLYQILGRCRLFSLLTCLHLYRAYGPFSIPTARRFSLDFGQLALSTKEIQKSIAVPLA